MLPETDLFIQLMRAKTSFDVDVALASYSTTTKNIIDDVSMSPNKPSAPKPKPYDALFERVVNGFNAAAIKSRDVPLVYVINTETAITVADIGSGINGADFQKTVLSLKGKGCGSFAFSPRTIIASVPKYSDTVYFTVVQHTGVQHTGNYVYKAVSSNVFSCPLASIPRNFVQFPEKFNKNNLSSNLICLPKHGTIIRHIEYADPSISITNYYNFFREEGFGFSLPLRVLNCFKSKKKVYNIFGYGYVFDNRKPNAPYPVLYRNKPTSASYPIGGSNSIDIKFWIIGANAKGNKPFKALLRDANYNVFVTFEGRTILRLSTAMFMQNYPGVNDHVIIQVACDRLNLSQRNNLVKNDIEQSIINILMNDVHVTNYFNISVNSLPPSTHTNVVLQFKSIFTNSTDPHWPNIKAGNVPVLDVAFRFDLKSNGILTIWINSEFDPYVRMQEKLMKSGNIAVIQNLNWKYTDYLIAYAKPWIDTTTKMSSINDDDTHKLMSAYAQAFFNNLLIYI